MIRFRQSIGFRLLVLSFILLPFPLLVDSFIVAQKRYQQAVKNAKGILLGSAQLKELPLARLQPLGKPLIQLIIDDLNLENNFPNQPSELLNQKLNQLNVHGNFHGIFLIKITENKRYIVVASSRSEDIGKDYTRFFDVNRHDQTASFEKGYTDYIFLEQKSLRPFLLVVDPIFSLESDRDVGILVFSKDISEEFRSLLQSDQREFEINFALLFPSSMIFEATDSSLKYQYFTPLEPEFKHFMEEQDPLVPDLIPEKALKINQYEYPFFEFLWKSHPQIGYIKKFPNANYTLLAYAPKKEIFKNSFLDFFHIYSIYGCILLIGGILTTLAIIKMAKPIQDLGLVMQKIQNGDIHLRYKEHALGFEINSLGHVFNETVNAVLLQKHLAEEERVKREIYVKELRLGQHVQRSLLPQSMPEYPGVEVAQIYIPALEVGGDFFDIFVKEENNTSKLVLTIADVSGKGVQACFYSLSVKNMLRIYAQSYQDIAHAMLETNALFFLDTAETGMFVTALCAVYDYQTHILSYYSCGHNPGLILRKNGIVDILENRGMAMGVISSGIGQTLHTELSKGDSLIFYTDGITEAHNEKFELFGEKRLIECLKKEQGKAAEVLVQSIVSQVNAFVHTAKQHDDITLLVMKITE